MRKLLVLATFATLTMAAACNTVEGVGRDVTAAGRAVTDASRDAR